MKGESPVYDSEFVPSKCITQKQTKHIQNHNLKVTTCETNIDYCFVLYLK